MPVPLHGHSVTLLRPLAPVLARLGFDPDRFLADIGITAETSTDVFVPAVTVETVLARMAAARGDATLGISIAQEAVVRPFGLFGHLLWLSGTLRDVLLRATRFYSLVTRRGELSFDETHTATTAAITRREAPGAGCGSILTEFAFASFVLHARAGIEGKFALSLMRFAHQVADPAPYEIFFDAPVAFGAPVDQLVLDVSMLDKRNRGADPVTAAVIEAHATRLGAEISPRTAFVDEVRRSALAELLTSSPSLGAVARRMGMGERSLRRRLAEEAVTLREIVRSVRCEKARELLAAGYPIKEIAFALGFSEPSAFSRAYKRWTGEAPSIGAPTRSS